MRHRLYLPGLIALLIGIAGQHAVCAAPHAVTHERVRQGLKEHGQAEVIVTIADVALPQAGARDWHQRVAAISSMRARVMADAPQFKVHRSYVTQPLLAGAVDAESLKQLERSPLVTGIYPNRKFKVTLDVSGPLIGQPEAQAAGFTGTGVSIAIIDSGIDYKHPDFGGNANTTINLPPPATTNSTKVLGGVNYVPNPSTGVVDDPTDVMDDYGHGTHVAGIAAGMDSVYRGIAPGATLVAYRVVDDTGSADTQSILAALDQVIVDQAAYNIKVVNLSLGDGYAWTSDAEFRSAYPDEAAVYDDVESHGIVIVAASGNEGNTAGIGSPAIISSVISVGATYDRTYTTTQDWGTCADTDPVVDSPVCFSDRGELIDLYAPGAQITSAKWSGLAQVPSDPTGFITEAGTSSASPHVAGAAACVINMLYPDPTVVIDPNAVRRRLEVTGHRVVDPSTHVATPRVDLVGAMHPQTTGPDLVVTAVSTTATTAFPGDSIPLTVTVANQGNATSPACTAIVVLSLNTTISPQDYLVASFDVPILTAGQSFTKAPLTGTIPDMPTATFTLGAFVDSTYIVDETDQTNQSLAGGQLSIGSSAYVAGNDIPAMMVKGQSYTITVDMTNDSPTSWDTSDGYQLMAVSPVGTTRWGTTTVPLSGGTLVDPGDTATFTFNVTAPTTVGWYPCDWQMAKGSDTFGEAATGAVYVQVTDDQVSGQDYPAISGDRVAYMDYRDATFGGLGSISVTNISDMSMTRLPQDIPFPLDAQGYPLPPFTWTTDPANVEWFPDISGPWVSWMVDDVPDPSNSYNWFLQVLSYNLDTPSVLPVRVNYNLSQPSDQWVPSVDGNLMVEEDYRNDPNRYPTFGLTSNSDIYIADLSAPVDSNYAVPTYPICTAPGPQMDPRISGNIVVWEDYRDGLQSDIYMYDLSVDTGNTGVPNWKKPAGQRPNPDPAETRLTSTTWDEMYPDVSGRTVVWMDLRRAESSAQTPTIDIYALDLDTMTETPVATDPPAYRIQPRIDGRNVVWTDYRYGQGEIYWENLDSGIAVPVGASAADESVADISGNSIAYSQQVIVDSYGYPIYNIFAQELLPNASVGVHTFTDVDNSYWAWAWIEAVAAKGVALGYSDGTYGPTLQVTRDQMAVYIARALAGGDSGVTTPVTTKFSDVPADYWANKYIAYCVNAGVVQGYPDGTYEPTTVVTRDAMAVFISRAVAGGDAEVSGPATVAFSDVPTSQWAYTYIEYCANPTRGIVQGYSDGTYRPGDPVTRDQMAVFISRAFKYTTD